MNKAVILGTVLALAAGSAGAMGIHGPATCYFATHAGIRSAAHKCEAALSGSMLYESGDIWLGKKHYSSARVLANDDGTASHQKATLHNVSAEFQGRDNYDETFCAPVKGSSLSICATNMREVTR